MKVIVSGDWHLGLKLGGRSMRDEIIKSVNQIISAAVGADIFVQLGDVFHTNKPSPQDYADAISLFKRLIVEQVFVLKGNHDEGIGDQPSAVAPLREIEFSRFNFELVTEPGIYEALDGTNQFFLMAPHINDTKARERIDKGAQEWIQDVFQGAGGVAAAFAHLDVPNALVRENFSMRGGKLNLPIEITRKMACPVINGHVHHWQKMKRENVLMPGSVIPMSFGDEQETKKYIELDL